MKWKKNTINKTSIQNIRQDKETYSGALLVHNGLKRESIRENLVTGDQIAIDNHLVKNKSG